MRSQFVRMKPGTCKCGDKVHCPSADSAIQSLRETWAESRRDHHSRKIGCGKSTILNTAFTGDLIGFALRTARDWADTCARVTFASIAAALQTL